MAVMYNPYMGIKTELRNTKRKEVVEAIIIRKQPVYLVRQIIYQQEPYSTGYRYTDQEAGEH
jgi:hypothetical protein